MLVLQVQLFILEALMSLHMKNALKFGDPDGKLVNKPSIILIFISVFVKKILEVQLAILISQHSLCL